LRRARELRAKSTDAEYRLWWMLRNRQMNGAKFRRQHVVAPYILDFYCVELKLCIELDGDQHAEPVQEAYDARRTQYLEERGIRVMRFGNREVLMEMEGVLERIWEAVGGGAFEE